MGNVKGAVIGKYQGARGGGFFFTLDAVPTSSVSLLNNSVNAVMSPGGWRDTNIPFSFSENAIIIAVNYSKHHI